MEEQILAVDLSTEQTLEVNLPEQDNIAQIDVYWQDEVTLDLDLSLMYIVSGQREIQDYVDNKSKPEIDDYIETYAKPIVSEVVEEIAAPVVGDYIENVTKPNIKEFADKEMASYAQVAGEQAAIATNQATLAEASALASSETLTSVNNKAEEFEVAVNTAKVDIQSVTDTSITNINNTVSAEIIPNLEGYVSSATNQASIAASKANEAQSSANASKTSETNAQSYSDQAKGYAESVNPERFLNKEMITNCITEIPQDIKLELNNGVLTLKAGSKVYVPNGFEADGVTPKFDVVVIAFDKTVSAVSGGNAPCVIFYNNDNGTLYYEATTKVYSGTESTTDGTYYHTGTNIIDRITGSTTITSVSLPLCLCSRTSSIITSIDQVFNGFGYIGSTIFALPNVKGLIPDGRNADGSLRNIEFAVSSVERLNVASWAALSSSNSGYFMRVKTNIHNYIAFQPFVRFYTKLQTPNNTTITNFAYIEEENQWYFWDANATNWIKAQIILYVSIEINKGITSFQPKLPFHAVDRNDSSWIAQQAMPSGKRIDLTIGASPTQFTAPANGWFDVWAQGGTTSNNKYLEIINNTTGLSQGVYGTANYHYKCHLPAKKGDKVSVQYANMESAPDRCRFVYAEGEK
jgi:hypothetical protein